MAVAEVQPDWREGIVHEDVAEFYRQLLGYGALVTGLAPLLLWIIFVVIPA